MIVHMIRPFGGCEATLPAKQVWKKKNHTVQGLKPDGPQTYVMAPSNDKNAIAAAMKLDDGGSTAYVYADEHGVPSGFGVTWTVFTKTVAGTPCAVQFAYFESFSNDGKLCAFFVRDQPVFPAAPVVGSYAYEESFEDANKVWRLQCLVLTLRQVFAEASDAEQQGPELVEEYAAKTFALFWMKAIKGLNGLKAQTDKLSHKKFVALVMAPREAAGRPAGRPAAREPLVQRVANAVQEAVQEAAGAAGGEEPGLEAPGGPEAGEAAGGEEPGLQADPEAGLEAPGGPEAAGAEIAGAVWAAGAVESGEDESKVLTEEQTEQLLSLFGLRTGSFQANKKTLTRWNTVGFDYETSTTEWKMWYLGQPEQIKARVLEQWANWSTKAGCLSEKRMSYETLKARTWFFMKDPHAPGNIQYLTLADVRNYDDPVNDPVYVPATIHKLEIKVGIMGYSTQFSSNIKHSVKVMKISNKMVYFLFDDSDARTVDFTPIPGVTNRNAQIKEFKDLFSPAEGWKNKRYAEWEADDEVHSNPQLSKLLWPTVRDQRADERANKRQ